MTAGVTHFQRLGVTGPPPKVRLHGEATTPLVSPFVGYGFRVPTQMCHWGLPQCLPTMPLPERERPTMPHSVSLTMSQKPNHHRHDLHRPQACDQGCCR